MKREAVVAVLGAALAGCTLPAIQQNVRTARVLEQGKAAVEGAVTMGGFQYSSRPVPFDRPGATRFNGPVVGLRGLSAEGRGGLGSGFEIGAGTNMIFLWDACLKYGILGVGYPDRVASAILVEVETDVLFTNNNTGAVWVWTAPLVSWLDGSCGLRYTWPLNVAVHWYTIDDYGDRPRFPLNAEYGEVFVGFDATPRGSTFPGDVTFRLGAQIRFPRGGERFNTNSGDDLARSGPVYLGSFGFAYAY